MKKYLIVILAAFVFGCTGLQVKSSYIASNNDIDLKLIAGGLATHSSSFMNRRTITIDAYYADQGCPTFNKADKGYIGTVRLNGSEDYEQTIKIPKGKNVFLQTTNTWSNVGYECHQAIYFKSSAEAYELNMKILRRSLTTPCKADVLYKTTDSNRDVDISSQWLPFDFWWGLLGEKRIDQETCAQVTANESL